MAVAMFMSVTVPTGVTHFPQRAQRYPAPEADKSDAGRSVDDVAEPCGEGNAGEPYHHSDQQGRQDVADPGLQ